MTYKVKLDVFEGPFDLLVYLIENARMSVYDIQVAKITSQYMEYIERAAMLDIALASEFMVLAAALIEIKTKMLLPRMKIDESGNFEYEDPRSELVSRLLEYKRFKTAAELLEKSEEQARLVFEKPKEDLSPFTGEPDIYLKLDIKQFMVAFNQFLLKKKRIDEIRKNYGASEKQRISMEEKIRLISKALKARNKKTIFFKELIQPEYDKEDVAFTFASILEMAKSRAIKIWQSAPFGAIKIAERADGDGR